MGIKARRRAMARVTDVAWSIMHDEPIPESDHAASWAEFFAHYMPHMVPASGGCSYADQWEECRAEVLAEWARERPGTRPSTWWRLDAPEPKREHEGEAEYLARHGLLTDAERRALGKTA
jgi:hypothetical protein